MKDIIEAISKAPFRILLMLPTAFFWGLAGFLAYKDKDPFQYFSLILVGVLFFAFLWKYIKVDTPASLASNDWFKRIADKLEDCGSAHIYLRKFDHPDNFNKEHREALLRIMQAFKKKLSGGAAVTIIAYHPDPSEQSGLDWLRASGVPQRVLEHSVIVRTSQPNANSSSVYVFDDRTSFYNKKDNEKTIYKEESFSSSIVHDLILRGFANLIGDRT